MITSRIYCYYANIGWDAQADVADLWKERWLAEGWDATILGPDDCKADPRYDAMQEAVKAFPCLPTSKHFERSAFERWLAFSHVDEPAAVCDFDVFPIRRFPPKDFGQLPVSGDGAGGPGFIVGNREDFSRIADAIISYQPEPDDIWDGMAHVCDMRIMRKRQKELYPRITVLTITLGFPNFGTAPLGHFSNSSLDAMTNCHRDMKKAEAIRLLLGKLYQR